MPFARVFMGLVRELIGIGACRTGFYDLARAPTPGARSRPARAPRAQRAGWSLMRVIRTTSGIRRSDFITRARCSRLCTWIVKCIAV